VKLVPDLFEMRLAQVRLDHLAGIPLIDVHRTDRSQTAQRIKRGVDIIFAGLALIFFSPVFALTALAIRLDSRGPIFIGQTRIGKGGKPFTFFKFRSMRIDADQLRDALLAQQGAASARIFKDRRDPRRTRVGRIIRQLSIDELPQLVNVLRGDMSLVGPRPPLPQEVAAYEPHHFKRLEVIGGITGMWQVSGRSTIESFEEIIMLDSYYIDNWSLILDLKILLRTILAVLSRTGAY
jgi:exopolysaccharide biosynthesis polyprenyl glycosylphosphotransferase